MAYLADTHIPVLGDFGSSISASIGLKNPIYFEKLMLEDLVNWTKTHSENNPINSITENFSLNSGDAYKLRLQTIVSKIRNKLDLIKQDKLNITLFTVPVQAYTLTGKRLQTIHIEMIDVPTNINEGEDQTVILISSTLTHEHELICEY